MKVRLNRQLQHSMPSSTDSNPQIIALQMFELELEILYSIKDQIQWVSKVLKRTQTPFNKNENEHVTYNI